MSVKVRVKLDQNAVDNRTTIDNGKILDAIGDRFDDEFQTRCASRIGGTYWTTKKSVILGGTRSQISITVASNRPRVIVPKSARVLVFSRDGSLVHAHRVNHPGSSPPVGIVRDVIDAIDSNFTSIAGAAT